MQSPLQISFRGIEPSEAVETRVRDRVAHLRHIYPRITSCRVVVQAPHSHHHRGGLYEIKLNLAIPGDELVFGHEGSKDPSHEDVYVAIRDIFDAAERSLTKHAQRK